jgi:hypothetical protein
MRLPVSVDDADERARAKKILEGLGACGAGHSRRNTGASASVS